MKDTLASARRPANSTAVRSAGTSQRRKIAHTFARNSSSVRFMSTASASPAPKTDSLMDLSDEWPCE